MTTLRILTLGVALSGTLAATAADLQVPAFTAYLDPEPRGARVSGRGGITGWSNPSTKVQWFGHFKNTGALECSVTLRLPADTESKLRLTLGEQSREVVVTGAGRESVIARFGEFEIKSPGYHCFRLEALNSAGQPNGDLEALLLSGPAVADAHFNLLPRRNAASVHLSYPVPADAQVEAFYSEVTAVEDPVWTFYMACGWHRGYFGMQVNSPTERRIIFSVWDSGNEPVDRGKVAAENRVTLVAKGEDVYAGDFGNEGTGGHSHLKYLWKTGEPQRFVVTAKPVDGTHTIYSGYYFHPDKQEWMLISSWKAPKDGGYLRRPHGFSENFVGGNGHLRRKALFGNQWMRTSDGKWTELTTVRFSHDPTGRADRLDRFMGVEQGMFFLSHGGFVEGFTRSGESFSRPTSGQSAPSLPPVLLP
jgi:hypothetical protein